METERKRKRKKMKISEKTLERQAEQAAKLESILFGKSARETDVGNDLNGTSGSHSSYFTFWKSS